MTDGPLMDADCIHGVVWFDCEECALYYPHDCHDFIFPCPMKGGHSIVGLEDE